MEARVDILVALRFLFRCFPVSFMSLFPFIFFSATVFSHFPSSLAHAHCIVVFAWVLRDQPHPLTPVSARRGYLKPVVPSQLRR